LPYLLELSNYRDVIDRATPPEVARIGRFDGVQVRRMRVFQWRGLRQVGESIYRLVSTARGDQISVEYTPLGEVTPGDMELFDAVCRAVQLDDPAASMSADDALARAGLKLASAENWAIIGPDFAEVRGFYVQGPDGGEASWALGVFRTWLSGKRTPADLLRSFVAWRWSTLASQVEFTEWTRSDGVAVAAVERPALEQRGGQVTGVWVVARSPAEVAVIFAFSGQSGASAAKRAGAKIAEAVRIVADYPPEGVEAAEARGNEFVALLREEGVDRWWTGSAATSYYVGEVYGHVLTVVSRREPIGADAARGYKGTERYYGDDPDLDEQRSWTVDSRGEAYTYTVWSDFDSVGEPTSVHLHDWREAGQAVIQHSGTTAARGEKRQIPVGPAFVCPPVDVLAPAWAASQQGGPSLIELMPLRGATTYTQLLTPLEPDTAERQRVLQIDDYWPRGTIMVFDAESEMVYQSAPEGYFQRATREEAQRVLRALRR